MLVMVITIAGMGRSVSIAGITAQGTVLEASVTTLVGMARRSGARGVARVYASPVGVLAVPEGVRIVGIMALAMLGLAL